MPMPSLVLSGRPLIGLAGLARVGKDTAAGHLVRRYGFGSYAFASPIKRALCTMFGLTAAQLDGDQKEVEIDWLGKSPRQLMQTLGTEWGRGLVVSDVWTRACAHSIAVDIEAAARRSLLGWSGGVVSDVRFENEARWIREQGGVVLHIVRTDADTVASHASEAGVFAAYDDVVVDNNGSLASLFMQLDDVVDNVVPRLMGVS